MLPCQIYNIQTKANVKLNNEKAIAFYISGNINETKKTMELVNRDNLDQNTVLVYDNLLNKLK